LLRFRVDELLDEISGFLLSVMGDELIKINNEEATTL
jgi:hypothetical protein